RRSCPRKTCRPCGAETACGACPCPCPCRRSSCRRSCLVRRRRVLVRMPSLNLHPVETVVVGIVHVALPAFTGLADRREPALDAAPLGLGLTLGARPIDDFLFLVH